MAIPSLRNSLKFAAGALMAILAFSSQAGGNLSAEDVKALLTDKTAFAKHEKERYNYVNYFAPDGSAKQLTDKGEKKTGTWHVESDGALCVSWAGDADSICGPLIASGEGQYKRMRTNPKNLMGGLIHVITFERFENGNSKGL
ncbi:MAG: hypothetical protein QG662_487 [Pseudomonadota bacterium]|nr:hypothetical protein [Pseudomonadota bacterium]